MDLSEYAVIAIIIHLISPLVVRIEKIGVQSPFPSQVSKPKPLLVFD
jgi:hypothetical protein